MLPPPLDKLAHTPVLRSEMPAGFTRARISQLPPNRRYHTLGAVRIDFSNAHASESASYALLASPAAAVALARIERGVRTGGLFHVQVTTLGRVVVGVTAFTRAQAKTLLALAVAHFRRSVR